MRLAVAKLVGAFSALLVLAVAIYLSHADLWVGIWMLLFIFVALPFLILSWIDLAAELRRIEHPSRVQQLAGVLFGIPQALFGLLALLCGGAIIAWVLYKEARSSERRKVAHLSNNA